MMGESMRVHVSKHTWLVPCSGAKFTKRPGAITSAYLAAVTLVALDDNSVVQQMHILKPRLGAFRVLRWEV